ncbi:MAG: iron ABC transporter permease [Deltaproteobacteria bacterium]|nr:iron ABC transporter permease [Deltaproteobacteria bacterium]
MRWSRPAYAVALLLGGALLAAALLLSLASGAVDLGAADVASALERWFSGAFEPGTQQAIQAQIIGELRLPRALLGALIGGTLAVAGAALQAMMKSPLADPFILGVSSGASVGAALAVVLGLAATLGAGTATVLAFLAALGSVVIVYAIARVGGQVPAVRLLLAGVAWSSFASALTGLLLYLAPEASQVRGVVFWLLGGLGGAEWSSVAWTGAVAIPGAMLLFLTAPWLNLLLLGDEAARSLGLEVGRARALIALVTALVTGAAVAFSGAIGFVGLVVPHMLRPFTGPEHRRLLPACWLFGAAILVAMDTLARTLLAPREIPVGILTGLVGAPFFLALLRKTHREGDLAG